MPQVKDIHELRARLRQRNSITAGIDGERCAKAWLERNGWKFICIDDQDRGTMSDQLKSYGGKRPDFLAHVGHDETIVALDAKHVSTDDCQTFAMTDAELAKYRGLEQFLLSVGGGSEVEVVFMVIPKERNCTRMAFVGLFEFNHGAATSIHDKPATAVSLTDRDDLWVDIEPNDSFKPNPLRGSV